MYLNSFIIIAVQYSYVDILKLREFAWLLGFSYDNSTTRTL